MAASPPASAVPSRPPPWAHAHSSLWRPGLGPQGLEARGLFSPFHLGLWFGCPSSALVLDPAPRSAHCIWETDMGWGLHTKTPQDRSAGCGHLLGARAMSKGEEAGSHIYLLCSVIGSLLGPQLLGHSPPYGRPQKTPVTDRRGRASPGQAACSRLCPFAPCTSRARSAGGRHAPRGRGCGARPTSWGVTPRGREARVSTRCAPPFQASPVLRKVHCT